MKFFSAHRAACFECPRAIIESRNDAREALRSGTPDFSAERVDDATRDLTHEARLYDNRPAFLGSSSGLRA